MDRTQISSIIMLALLQSIQRATDSNDAGNRFDGTLMTLCKLWAATGWAFTGRNLRVELLEKVFDRRGNRCRDTMPQLEWSSKGISGKTGMRITTRSGTLRSHKHEASERVVPS